MRLSQEHFEKLFYLKETTEEEKKDIFKIYAHSCSTQRMRNIYLADLIVGLEIVCNDGCEGG